MATVKTSMTARRLLERLGATELAEGSTLVKGEIGCVAFKSGLVCGNSKGRGFLLSRMRTSQDAVGWTRFLFQPSLDRLPRTVDIAVLNYTKEYSP
jgi:hypothetical protein